MPDKIDKYKGVVEIEILGEVRGFKFGMGAMARLCQLEGLNFKGVQEKLSSGDPIILLNLLYAAAVEYVRLYKKPNEPTKEEVSNWVDYLSDDKQAEIIKTAFYQPESPNTTAP